MTYRVLTTPVYEACCRPWRREPCSRRPQRTSNARIRLSAELHRRSCSCTRASASPQQADNRPGQLMVSSVPTDLNTPIFAFVTPSRRGRCRWSRPERALVRSQLMVLARDRDGRFGSSPAVQAAQRHGRSTSLSGPAEPERADLAIRHRRAANALDALGSISGPAAKRAAGRPCGVG
jgi:hypothetical protein